MIYSIFICVLVDHFTLSNAFIYTDDAETSSAENHINILWSALVLHSLQSRQHCECEQSQRSSSENRWYDARTERFQQRSTEHRVLEKWDESPAPSGLQQNNRVKIQPVSLEPFMNPDLSRTRHSCVSFICCCRNPNELLRPGASFIKPADARIWSQCVIKNPPSHF